MAEVLALSSAIASLVTLVGQVSKLSYDFLSDIRNASKSQKLFLQEVSALTQAFLQMEDALDLKPSVALRPSLQLKTTLKDSQDLLSDVKDSLVKATEGESAFSRFKSSMRWPFNEKEVKSTVERLRRHRDILVATLASDTFTITVATHKKVEQMTQGKNLEQLHQWLENPGPAQAWAAIYESACPGTGQWLLAHQKYLEWRDGPQSLIWCYGDPGVGKTVTASVVMHDLQVQSLPGTIALCHFCDTSKRSCLTVLQNLLWQVVKAGNSEQLSCLERLYKNSKSPSLNELTQILSEIARFNSGVYLIIDALDEFTDRRLLVSVLQKLSSTELKILVTSRDIPDIRDAFRSEPILRLQASRSDLELYIEKRLTESDLCDYMQSHSDMIAAIANQADGVFLLARLTADQVLSCTTVKKMRQALKLMPANLSEAYGSNLKRILEQPQNRSALAIRTIGWVSHAERHLKVDELRHALAVEKGARSLDEEDLTSIKIILQVCIGILILDSESGTFRLIHHTAYEYFRQLHEHFAQIQLDMAETCLTYLTYQPFCQGPCSTVEALRRRYEEMPLLSYAAQCWGHHAVKVEREMGAQILQALKHDSIRLSSFQALQYRELNDVDLAAALFESLPTGLKPLHVAAYWNLSPTGKTLLDDGADTNVCDKQRWTALHWASSLGSGTFLETLLQYRADINALDFSGWTPLFWAAIQGHEQIVRRLLEEKADHLLMDSNGWTCLHWAASKGNSSITQVLLDHHANSKASQPSFKIWLSDLTVTDAKRCQPRPKSHAKTALEIAADKEDIRTFDTILEDLSSRGNSQSFNELWTQRGWDDPRVNVPWRVMTKADHFDTKGLIRFNIEQGHGSLEYWKTKLLHGAIRDGKVLVVQLLIKLGADIKNSYRRKTPLEHAALLEDPSIATILLSNGAHDTQVHLHRDYRSPLELAIAHGFVRTAEVFIKGGFDVMKSENGHPLLFLACGASSKNYYHATESLPLAMVKMLIEHGADMHTTNESGQNALHIALEAAEPDVQIVGLLLDGGVDINAKDLSGKTPFHCFCKYSRSSSYSKSEEMLKLLLSHLPPGAENSGCQLQSLRDEDPIVETPLAMAIEAENWPIFTILLERRAVLHTTRPLDKLLGKSAYVCALQPRAVKLLLEAGASATTIGSMYGSSPWGHEALKGLFNNDTHAPTSFEDFRSILDMFLAHGLDVNTVNYHGETLLQVAVTEASPTHETALTQYLLDIGIDLYQAADETWDAFLLAAIHNRLDALRVLIAHATRMHTSPNQWLSISQTFVDKGSLTNEALFDLITSSLSRTQLLESPARDSTTPLQKAVELKNTALAAILLRHGANMNVTDQYGWTLLHTAAYNRDLSTVTLLLDRGADPNLKTAQWAHQGKRPSGLYVAKEWAGTALHVAAMVGAPALVSLLLKHGADPNADTGRHHGYFTRGHGPRALDIALDTGEFYGERENLGEAMLSVADMLVEHGAEVEDKATHLNVSQVCRFEGFSALWEKLRKGIERGEGGWIMCNDPTLSHLGDYSHVGDTHETADDGHL